MSIANLNQYMIQITSETYQCVSVNGRPTANFVTPDTKRGVQKLYLLKDGSNIYYVGVTSQPLSARFRLGFQENSPNGYHGYKWRHEIERAELLVWCFDNLDKEQAESIEGELVYLIRNKTGNWPLYQMEIHFHPDALEEQKQIANTMLNTCLE